MNINIQKFNEVANAAKAKTTDKRWQNAIDKAVAGVVSGWWIVTELSDSVAVTTETGQTYFANGSCQCKAFELGQPCKHRALARLIDLYNETAPVAVCAECPACSEERRVVAMHPMFAADVAESTRQQLLCEIPAAWPKSWPPLYCELLARFGKSNLDMLDDDQLRRVRMAIAL